MIWLGEKNSAQCLKFGWLAVPSSNTAAADFREQCIAVSGRGKSLRDVIHEFDCRLSDSCGISSMQLHNPNQSGEPIPHVPLPDRHTAKEKRTQRVHGRVMCGKDENRALLPHQSAIGFPSSDARR